MIIERTAYRIEADPGHRLMTLGLRGFWDETTANAFSADYDQAAAYLSERGLAEGEMLILLEFMDKQVQSSPIVERFKEFSEYILPDTRRVAVITGSSLQKLQAQRMAPYQHYRYFSPEQREEAKTWLLS